MWTGFSSKKVGLAHECCAQCGELLVARDAAKFAAVSRALKALDHYFKRASDVLACTQVVWQLRKAVLDELGYSTSAGVSHYKLLAKLGSGTLFCMRRLSSLPRFAVLCIVID